MNVGYSAEYRDNETNMALLKSLGQYVRQRRPTRSAGRSRPRSQSARAIALRQSLPPRFAAGDCQPIDLALADRGWELSVLRRCVCAARAGQLSIGSRRCWRRCATGCCDASRAVPVPETMSGCAAANEKSANRSRAAEPRRDLRGRRGCTRRQPNACRCRRRRPTTRSDNHRRRTPTATKRRSLSYTERLLKAKQQVWHDREQDLIRQGMPRPSQAS